MSNYFSKQTDFQQTSVTGKDKGAKHKGMERECRKDKNRNGLVQKQTPSSNT